MFASESPRPDLSRFAPMTTENLDSPTPVKQPIVVNAASSRRGKTPWKPWQKWVLRLGLLVAVLVSVGGILSYHAYTVAMELKFQSKEVEILARGAYDSFKAQNLPEAEARLQQVQEKFQGILFGQINFPLFFKFT